MASKEGGAHGGAARVVHRRISYARKCGKLIQDMPAKARATWSDVFGKITFLVNRENQKCVMKNEQYKQVYQLARSILGGGG